MDVRRCYLCYYQYYYHYNCSQTDIKYSPSIVDAIDMRHYYHHYCDQTNMRHMRQADTYCEIHYSHSFAKTITLSPRPSNGHHINASFFLVN